MNSLEKNIIYAFSFLVIILIARYFILNEDQSIYILKNISKVEAEKAIKDEYLDHTKAEVININNNENYTIAKVDLDKSKSNLLPLMIKNGYPFYVFQNNHLIYRQSKDQYYKGFSNKKTTYNLMTKDQWKEQILYKIPLYDLSPIYILIQKEHQKTLSDFITFPKKITKKNIEDLRNTNTAILQINTHGNHLDSLKYQFGSLNIIWPDTTYKSLSRIKIRGHSSFAFPKKKFNIIFDEPTNINGFEFKKNVLIGSYIDKSLLRNKLSDNLFSLLRNKKSSASYLHTIINDNYEGVYLMVEHPHQQFKNLIKKSDSLCFLLQIDRGTWNIYGAKSKSGYQLKYPDQVNAKIQSALNWFEENIAIEGTDLFEENIAIEGTELTDPFHLRIEYLTNRFEINSELAESIVIEVDKIMSPANKEWANLIKEKAIQNEITMYQQAIKDAYWLKTRDDPKAIKIEFEKHKIDLNSFVDFFIINELSKNIDAYRLSTFLSYINQTFQINIIWDFDLSWGLSKNNNGFDYKGFIIESELSQHMPFFWNQLWKNQSFQKKIKERYSELRYNTLSNDSIENIINNDYAELHPSIKYNFEKWQILNKDIWPNKFIFESHQDEVNYLKEWTFKRLQWLDSEWMSKN